MILTGRFFTSHKRSKSSLALSILHRDKSSKSDDREDESPTSPTASSSSQQQQPPQRSFSITSGLRRKQNHDMAADSPTTSDPKFDTMSSNSSNPNPSLGGEKAASTSEEAAPSSQISLEQSVKTFKLFEILRSGDTTAISKAIKEAKEQQQNGGLASPGGTTVLHLAVQCAEPQVIEYVLSSGDSIDVNARDRDGNTPLHLAAQLGRDAVVRALLERPEIDDSIANYRGQTALDLARTPEIFQQLQLARSLFIDAKTKEIQDLIARGEYEKLEKVLEEPRVEGTLDVNSLELVTDPQTIQTGGTLLHEGARKKDTKLIQILLLHGADPFRRDKKGKLPQDVTKDDKTRAIVKRSPAAVIAQRGIQERAILGNAAPGGGPRGGSMEVTLGGKDAREMKGYLKKWTNYTGGFKLRWFVLEDGVLSYYKHQDDAGSACRGAISMRIAKLHMDPQDKTRFEIHGKSSVKYHLKANHVVEAKRWFWALNNAIQWAKDEAKEEERRRNREAELLRQAKADQEAQGGRLSEAASEVSKGPPRSSLVPPATKSTVSFSRVSTHTSRTAADTGEDEGSVHGSYDLSVAPHDVNRVTSQATGPIEEYDDYGDYASSHEAAQPGNKDAFNITAQSAKLQLDLLASVSASLQAEKAKNPNLTISDPVVDRALAAYDSAVSSLNGLLVNLLKISRDRDAYWQYRLDKEADTRKMWEESMARIVQEHEELQNRINESEDKRKRIKKALKEVLESASASNSRPLSHVQVADELEKVKDAERAEPSKDDEGVTEKPATDAAPAPAPPRASKPQSVAEYADLAESESDEDEFYDAVEAEEIPVEELPAPEPPAAEEPAANNAVDLRAAKQAEIEPSFQGYEDPPRERLKLDKDDRPKISLWVGIPWKVIGMIW